LKQYYLHIVFSLFILLAGCKRNNGLKDDAIKNIDYCDIKPILEKSCLKCHNQDGIAPFSFENIETFRQKKSTVLYVLDSNIMPPWKPDPSYRTFKHQFYITETERKKLYNWIDNGCKNSGQCPLAVVNKDSIFSYQKVGDCYNISMGYRIPENIDNYKCFIVLNPFKKDVYLSAIDLVPGNALAVHHMSAFIANDQKVIQGCNDKNDEICNCDNSIDDKSVIVSNWTKGSHPIHLEKGYGFLLPKNAYLAIQIHYSGGFEGVFDTSKVCFKVTKDSIVHEVFFDFKNKFDIHFEPNEVKYDTLVLDVPRAINMQTIWPHTHNIAKNVLCFAKTPTNEIIPLVRIPNWDYLWQSSYEFVKPISIPAHSKIYMICLYDNTENNKRNPNHPPQKVIYGRKAQDEMLVLMYSYFL
jgi:hypothetical protein